MLMTPSSYGGAESALQYAALGLRKLGVEVDVLAMTNQGGAEWSDQCKTFITRGLDWKRGRVAGQDNVKNTVKALGEYDGIVLSDTYFGDKRISEIVCTSDQIAPWTSARHWNSTAKTVYERHELAKASPKWSRRYVSFWPSVEEAFPEVSWARGILPYIVQDRLHGLRPISMRPVDFGYVGRTDPKKGVLTFVSALEGLTRHDPRPFKAVIAGAPTEIPGGPHIYAVGQKLEEWGWVVAREDDTMKSKWSATHPRTGSIIWHTGAYGPAELPRIFGSIKCFLNTTSGKYAPQHLEYVTMEALDAGCMVIAPTDWPDYHYGDANGVQHRPVVSNVPEESYRIKKGNRIIYNDVRPEAPETTYRPFAEKLAKAMDFFATPDVDAVTAAQADYNRQILSWAHDPARAGQAYLDALGLHA